MSVVRRYRYLIIVVALLAILFAFFHDSLNRQLWALFFKLNQWQLQYQQQLNAYVLALKQQQSWLAWSSLLVAGFVYGVLHAAGPGHGKAIITTFVLTQRQHYASSLLISIGGALLQGLSAIVWVALSFVVLGWFIRDSVEQILWLNRLAYVIVIALGAWIIWRQAQRLRHKHSDHDCACGHHHGTTEGEHSLSAKLLAMFAIGVRPCSGAVMTLAVAWSWGIPSVGIATTMAMAVGTAVTVSAIALSVVFGRVHLLERHYRQRQQQTPNYWLSALATLGGIILIALGTSMWLGDSVMQAQAISRPF